MTERLDWDSNFFGFETGKITDLEDLTNEKLRPFNLIYFFSNKDLKPSDFHSIQQEFEVFPADIKLTFSKTTTFNYLPDLPIVHALREDLNDIQLQQLALESGNFSRFRTDPHFDYNLFKKLYFQWLYNSIQEGKSTKTFLYKTNTDTVGFVTTDLKKDHVAIGLIAVDVSQRGKGIALKLLQKAENYIFSHSLPVIKVATQGTNAAAINLYKKSGFELENKVYIYHLWKKERS